jgi:hypothetical protein
MMPRILKPVEIKSGLPKAKTCFWNFGSINMHNILARCCGIGYRWQRKKMFRAAFSNSKECVNVSPIIKNNGYTETNGVWHLKNNLRHSHFSHPFLELYREPNEYFFGKFDSRNRISSVLVNTIGNFFQETLTPLGTIHVANVLTKKLKPASEARETERVVKSLRLMSRSQRIARAAKKRDHYKCRICGFNFASTYPSLENGFSECHHVKPLGRRGRAKVVVTKVDELITVCSNCHRMLHKAEGRVQEDPVDICAITATGQRK